MVSVVTIRKVVRTFFLISIAVGILYIVYPTPVPPPPPPNSLISQEPADTESMYRKSFFTNLSREEIMKYYKNAMGPMTKSLIIPPEESFSVIRDQTRTSWLEELVHIGKDSLYINGYYPTKPTEQIYRNDTKYVAKITIRYIPSSLTTRLTVFALAVISAIIISKEYT